MRWPTLPYSLSNKQTVSVRPPVMSVNFILEYYIIENVKPALTLLLQHFLVLGQSELLKAGPRYNVISTKKLCNLTISNISSVLLNNYVMDPTQWETIFIILT